MTDRWNPGDVVTRREVLGLGIAHHDQPLPLWHGDSWIEWPVHVVDHSDDQLVTFTAPGSPFNFPSGEWPIEGGRHPWGANSSWKGHGCLMVQADGADHAVWHFWDGEQREFVCWYINLQSAYVVSADSYDTQDLELDIVVRPDFSWELKDDEVMDQRVAEGRFTAASVEAIRELGHELTTRLEAGDIWWDTSWSTWQPDPSWTW